MKFFQKHIIIGVSVFLITVLLAGIPVSLLYQLRRSNEINRLNTAIHEANINLQKNLSECYAVSNTLDYIIGTYGFPKNFEKIGKGLLKSHDVIAAVEVVEGGVIRNVYPLKGNESVIGYNILKDSNRNMEAFKTIEKREMFFAGPFELKQGGIGVVGRMPIFRDSVFLGFSAVVIYFDTLLKRSGLKPSFNSEFEFQLTKVDPITKKEEQLIEGTDFDIKNERNEVVNVPAGEWKIYVRPKQNASLISLLPLGIFGLIIALVSGVFASYLYKQPVLLRRLVDEKVRILNINEKMLELAQESASIGSWAFNTRSTSVFMTDMCRQIYGMNASELLDADKMLSFCSDKEYRNILEQALKVCIESQSRFDVELKIKPTHAAEIWVRITGNSYRENGEVFVYGATQNIDQLIKSENERREILESIRDAFVACNDNWQVSYFNHAAELMFKISHDEIKGKNIFEMMNEKTRENIERGLDIEKLTAGAYTFEFFSEKLKIWCEVNVYRMSEGYSLYIRDVTVKHDYIRHIERQNKLMKEIAWMQSHVVRAPVARIMGSLELLDAETDEQGRKTLLNVIMDSSRELDAIVREITEKTDEINKTL